jgi:2-dehydro-3-deoxygluconokinase
MGDRLHKRVVAIGEAMLEMAPVGDGLYRRGFAGDTFNTAWHMAQLLGSRTEVGFVTRVGCDPLSDLFVTEAAADGLDVSGVQRDTVRQMGLYVIELDGYERTFHYWRKNSAARGLADDVAALVAGLDGAGLIHVSGITLAILSPGARASLVEALVDARRSGALVSFDPNFRSRLWADTTECRDAVSRMLGATDIALPSFDDERTLWGDGSPLESVERFLSLGVREVVLKDGSGFVTLATDGTVDMIETPLAVDICDTTGAGDSFNAGYLSARLEGTRATAAVALGQKLSAEVIRHHGARAPREIVRGMTGAST